LEIDCVLPALKILVDLFEPNQMKYDKKLSKEDYDEITNCEIF
jgi:hypothetical protein